MKQSKIRLLALLLALMLLSACGKTETPVQEQTQTPILVPEPEQHFKCTELGTPLADIRVRRALAHAIDMDTKSM